MEWDEKQVNGGTLSYAKVMAPEWYGNNVCYMDVELPGSC